MSCCHQVQYTKGCQPRRANHYPNIKCVNLANIHRFMSSQDSVNRPCFPHKGIITADSAHPKVMILKHAIVSPKRIITGDTAHLKVLIPKQCYSSKKRAIIGSTGYQKVMIPKKVIVPKKRLITGCTGYQKVMIPKYSKQKSYDSQKSYSSKKRIITYDFFQTDA